MDSNKVFKYAGVVALVVCTFAIGFVSGKVFDEKGSSNNNTVIVGDKDKKIDQIDFDLFWDIWDKVSEGYVSEEKVNSKEMFYGAIKGMVNSLDDPATIYLDPEETKSFDESNEGKLFEGIGAELGYENGQIIVVSPIKGSPAEKSGVRIGDVILKVDGKDVLPSESIYDVVLRIRGKAGTKVKLTVLHRNEQNTVDIEITRGQITVPSIEVEDSADKKYKVLKVSRFTDSSYSEWTKNWDKAVAQIIKSNPKGVILDLRGNPGGYFDAAVYAAGEFLPRGTVVAKQEDRYGKTQDYKVTRTGKLLKMPVVVLVNAGSASASEILTGALQKNNKGYVIGEDTYGKGTAQSVIPLNDGSSLHLTILKWLLPDGKWLNRDNPIKPNKEVKLTDDDFKKGNDPQIDNALEYLNK